MMMLSSNFIFNFTNFCVIVSFLIKLLTLGILFSAGVRPVAAVAKLVILGILPTIFLILASWHLYSSFPTISIFTTTLSLLKWTRTGTNLLIWIYFLSTSNLSTLFFKLPKLLDTFFLIYQYLIYLHQILN